MRFVSRAVSPSAPRPWARSSARRTGLLAGAVVMLATPGRALAQRTPTDTAAPALSAPPAGVWDSLYAHQRYFELRDAVASWRGPETPVVRYARGLLARAFNDAGAAVVALRPLVDGMPASLDPAQLRRAVDVLGDSYRAVYRYRESAEVYRAALRVRRIASDSAVRAAWQREARVGEALRDVLPQRVTWARASDGDTVAEAGARYAVRARVNGTLVAWPLRVDLSAPLTVLDSTTAATHAVRVLRDTVTTTIGGTRATAHLGVIASLGLGDATVSNVVTLVVPDGALTVSRTASSNDLIRGVVGVTVLDALGGVTFARDGRVSFARPGTAIAEAAPEGVAPRGTASPPAHMAFVVTPDGAVPIAEIAARGGRVGGRVVQPLGADPLRALTADTGPGDDAGLLASAPAVDAVALDFTSMTAVLERPRPPPVLPTITYPADAKAAPAADEPAAVPEDLLFIGLLFALFILPKALQRYRIPGAITSLLMGAAAGAFGLFQHDPTLHLLSTFGIVALFLFAGLEIDGRELRRHTSALVWHGVAWAALVAATAGIAVVGFDVAPRPATLIALALMTPSTGFILSSLAAFGLSSSEQVAVKTHAIGAELLALGVLFFVLQSTSFEQLAFSLAAIVGVVTVIPLAFRFFAAVVAPHAPRSEFAFLLMVAVVCAYATRRLGVYYLVGAFLVGVAAQRFRADHPAMSSEQIVDALESFGSVFIPFYFFRAGTQIVGDQLTPAAIGLGLLLAVACVPLRIGVVTLQRRRALGETLRAARRVGTALVPTLVFTLVIAEILQTQFAIDGPLTGALVLYTVLNTTVPAFVLRGAAPEFEHVEASPVAVES